MDVSARFPLAHVFTGDYWSGGALNHMKTDITKVDFMASTPKMENEG